MVEPVAMPMSCDTPCRCPDPGHCQPDRERRGQTGRLAACRVELELVARRFHVDACSALDAAVAARAIRHGNEPELNGAVAVARWSSSGDAGQRVLSRKDPRVSGLVAAALALHRLSIKPRYAGGWIVSI